ncbi:hypothetical protein ACSBOX_03240 [Arthrobacter sp. KN11-1C]|uniref:hypothetical protein n=1 Tax=Arthrobacter sp. KN11-1C TaxID=3445774 RepID=UPI003F9EED28
MEKVTRTLGGQPTSIAGFLKKSSDQLSDECTANANLVTPQMNESDAEVARTLSTIPVRVSRQMTDTEYQFRVAEVLNLFDIEAVGDETGVYYGDEGVELEDQPLVAAIRILLARRFGIPESLAI